jgi:hypothetical protein
MPTAILPNSNGAEKTGPTGLKGNRVCRCCASMTDSVNPHPRPCPFDLMLDPEAHRDEHDDPSAAAAAGSSAPCSICLCF